MQALDELKLFVGVNSEKDNGAAFFGILCICLTFQRTELEDGLFGSVSDDRVSSVGAKCLGGKTHQRFKFGFTSSLGSCDFMDENLSFETKGKLN